MRLSLRMRTRTFSLVASLAAWMLGTGVGCERHWRLSLHYRERAAFHADQERLGLRKALVLEEWIAYLKEDLEDAIARADELSHGPSRIQWLERSELAARVAAEDATKVSA